MTRLAVVVVTHDSTAVLGPTLAALTPQLRDDDELVVVDCASSDDPRPLLAPRARASSRWTRTSASPAGRRPARGATRRLLLFLNPDAVPAPGCLDAIREAPDGVGRVAGARAAIGRSNW